MTAPGPATEPIAVVGIGCRFAGGVDTPEGFWELLRTGQDVIGTIPDDRWQLYRDRRPGHAAELRRATRAGAFLPDIQGFDADFFGLTPREAELMDPQQRILLEVAWEALEHAGIPPSNLAGTVAGVFVGIGSDDYGRRTLEDLPGIEAWTGIGAVLCAAANRISHAFDLRGPSLAVDTACSASLTAVHLACNSLRLGECAVALAGGVNLIISPGLTLSLDAAGALAPDGRCKPFDAAADGYGRGEGGGLLVLKRLVDARRDGDQVLALVRGSAVRQEGRTNGIMAPDAAAQRHVLEQACHNAGIARGSVQYVEAHGTGTRAGDPVEASALSSVYGAGRPSNRPCLIGSVKSNIGHLEAAAGVAGLIKTVLALHHGEIPASLNFTSANPAIDWDTAGVRVADRHLTWPPGDGPRRAGVSGFGFGGTIAHVVLEQAPPTVSRHADGEVAPRLFPLSAGSSAALRQQAATLAGWLSAPAREQSLASVGHTLALRRSHLGHRAAVAADSREKLSAGLRRIAGAETPPMVALTDPGLVWVFSGHGSAWPGMGRELLTTEPVFARVIDDLEPIFLAEHGFSPRQALLDGDFQAVDRAQPMTFAMQLGLAEVWRSYGITPNAVIGHSVGEIAAAVCCGALSRHDGARLVCRRSRLLRRVAGRGAMVLVALPFDDVAERLSGRTDLVAAISSSPRSTVISGDAAAVEALMDDWRDVPLLRVASDVAFHSPQMDPLLAELAAAADLPTARPDLPMYPTALDDPRARPELDGAYWAANLRNPVRLAAAVDAAAVDGFRVFLEISPHPVVAHSIRETLAAAGHGTAFVGSSLRRGRPERLTLLASAGELFRRGVALDWARLQPAGSLLDLPRMAWQRRPHWRRPTTWRHDVDSHTLLGSPVEVAGRPLQLWRTVLDERSRPYPGTHLVDGVEIVPAAVLLNTLLQAGGGGRLCDVSLRLPLRVAESREIQVQRDGDVVRIASRARDGGWLTHTTAVVSDAEPEPLGTLTAESLPAIGRDTIRHRLMTVGVPATAFTWTVEDLQGTTNTLRARVRLEQPDNAPPTWAPALDAALSAAPAVFPNDAVARIVAHVDEVRLSGSPPETVQIVITVNANRADAVDISVAGTGGQVVARLTGVQFTPLDRDTALPASPRELLHEVVWRPLELTAPAEHRDLLLVTADPATVAPLREQLEAMGVAPRLLHPDVLDGLAGLDASTDVLVPAPGSSSGVPVPEAAAESAWLLGRIAQSLLKLPESPRLWCLTTGVRESRQEFQLAQAPLWGMSRVIFGEHPELRGGVIDLDPHGPSAGTLLRVLRSAPVDDVIAVRSEVPTVARLARTETEPPTTGLPPCRPDGTYLITGGLGVLGLRAARWLADRGARRIVLAGRGALPERTAWDEPLDKRTRRQVEAVRALEALGVTVRVVPVDIADTEAAAGKLGPDALGLPPIRGVLHLAGVLDNRLLPTLDEASLREVLRPKVDGACVLHNLFPPGSLDFLVLFSSCGHLLGLPGQAAYGSANAFLDALAAYRSDTVSLGWTSWNGLGMAANAAVDIELRARGVSGISVEEAFGAWDLAWRRGFGHYAVVRTRWSEQVTVPLPLLSELPAVNGTAVSLDRSSPVEGLAGLDAEQLRDRLRQEVGAQIAAEMGLSDLPLDPQRSLTEQGLDSVLTVVVRRRLEIRYAHPLPSTLLWQQPTVSAIADHLADLLAPDAEEHA